VRQCARDEEVDYREAAYLLAVNRVKQAINLRGFL
jgi:glutamate dehydrogenase/leucine dehydrogenase